MNPGNFSKLIFVLSVLFASNSSFAVVMYDEGREFIDGVSLLRDKEDPNAYYYLPTVPSVVIDRVTNKPKMLFVKFIDPSGEISGGLVHFLFSLDLPPDRVEELNNKLKKLAPGATIRGPVNLRAEGVELSGEADEATTEPASLTLIDPDGNPILIDQHR